MWQSSASCWPPGWPSLPPPPATHSPRSGMTSAARPTRPAIRRGFTFIPLLVEKAVDQIRKIARAVLRNTGQEEDEAVRHLFPTPRCIARERKRWTSKPNSQLPSTGGRWNWVEVQHHRDYEKVREQTKKTVIIFSVDSQKYFHANHEMKADIVLKAAFVLYKTSTN